MENLILRQEKEFVGDGDVEFSFFDCCEKKVGMLIKEWTGLAKELFTTADCYRVKIGENIQEKGIRILLIASAFINDYFFYERNYLIKS